RAGADGLRFHEAVVEVVELPFDGRLRVAVGQVRLRDENLQDPAAGERAHGAHAAVARRDLAVDVQPFADIAVAADGGPDLLGRLRDVDLHVDRHVFRLREGRGGDQGRAEGQQGLLHIFLQTDKG